MPGTRPGMTNSQTPMDRPSGAKNASQRGLLPPHARVFLAKPGAARYQVRAFSAPLLTAPLGPPQ
jgi:hypothetical protein